MCLVIDEMRTQIKRKALIRVPFFTSIQKIIQKYILNVSFTDPIQLCYKIAEYALYFNFRLFLDLKA